MEFSFFTGYLKKVSEQRTEENVFLSWNAEWDGGLRRSVKQGIRRGQTGYYGKAGGYFLWNGSCL